MSEIVTVKWSAYATVVLPDGEVYSPFQNDSYVAVVESLNRSKRIIVVLPPGSAQFHQSVYDAQVHAAFERANSGDVVVL